MHPPRILVLADDLTGALEVGAKFAVAGVRSQVNTIAALDPSELGTFDGVLVIDTETRHSIPEEAARVVGSLAAAARAAGYTHLYKKTDSTLRGNIGAELGALAETFGDGRVLYVPAYPQMGRTVKGGRLFIDGVPVSETAFALDPFNPVRESHIPTLLGRQTNLPAKSVTVADLPGSHDGGIVICDGETDVEIAAATQSFLQSGKYRAAAGPTGFAAHLARVATLDRISRIALPRIDSALIVNGSLHPSSIEQIDRALQQGIDRIEATPNMTPEPTSAWSILKSNANPGAATLEFAASMAQTAHRLLSQMPFDAIIVFGGDTAYALLETIGSPPLAPIGEVFEGIPISRIPAQFVGATLGNRERDLYLITKAGGYGDPNILSEIQKQLQRG